MRETWFEVGDYVRVINPGSNYSGAGRRLLSRFPNPKFVAKNYISEFGCLREGDKGYIQSVAPNGSGSENVYLISFERLPGMRIVGESGLTLIARGITTLEISEEDFETVIYQ